MHLQNMVLFLLTVLACWMFLLALFRIFVEDDSLAFTWATISSIIFAVHPVHVESIAWLYARKEPLLGLFTFLSLWTFIRARTGAWAYYAASGVFLLLAILSKPTALMIPAAMIVLDFCDPGAAEKRLFLEDEAPRLRCRSFFVVIPMGVRLVLMMRGRRCEALSWGLFHESSGGPRSSTYISLIGFTINYSADYPPALCRRYGLAGMGVRGAEQ